MCFGLIKVDIGDDFATKLRSKDIRIDIIC